MEKPTLLVVDDDADLRRTVCLLLGPLCRVVQASNGADALALVRRERPSLMLLDVVMPGMNGTEVLAAARGLDPNLTVLMLTGEQEIELAQKTLGLGAKAYITKPFDVSFLRAEVRRALGIDPAPEVDDGPPWKVVG